MVVYLAIALGDDVTAIEDNLTAAEETFTNVITSVDDEEIVLSYSLEQNYPNPFNPSTAIEFSIPQKENVKVDVYNTIGQKVTQLLNKEMAAGSYDVKFDASDLPSGVYFYTIEAGNFSMTKKMMLIK